MAIEPRPEHRIAKLLARAGVASRREIERMIADGRVALNGTVLDTPATVIPSLRGVTVDGNPVEPAASARLFVYHKPPGLLVTEHDPAGRPTIYDRLPTDLPRVVPVGRLDLATEGLLLLTTDGGLKRTLELPATGVERAYRARAYGDITQATLESLIEGVEIEGIRYGPIDANLERRTGANVWIELILTEGKNREVRRVLEYLGLQVSRLIRTRYGPFVLGDLPAGGVGEVRQHDLEGFVKSLKKGGGTDVRVEAVVPRTPARTVRAPDAPRAAPRITREPDAPRRATPVRVPRPGGVSRPDRDEAAPQPTTPRPGFRTPRSSTARQERAGRFAARDRSNGEDTRALATTRTDTARPRCAGGSQRPPRERSNAPAGEAGFRPVRASAKDPRRAGPSDRADRPVRTDGNDRSSGSDRPRRPAPTGGNDRSKPARPRGGGTDKASPARPHGAGGDRSRPTTSPSPGTPRPSGGAPRGRR